MLKFVKEPVPYFADSPFCFAEMGLFSKGLLKFSAGFALAGKVLHLGAKLYSVYWIMF